MEEDAVADLTDMIEVVGELLRVGAVAVRVVAQEKAHDPGGDTGGVPVVPCIASGRVGLAARKQRKEEAEKEGFLELHLHGGGLLECRCARQRKAMNSVEVVRKRVNERRLTVSGRYKCFYGAEKGI